MVLFLWNGGVMEFHPLAVKEYIMKKITRLTLAILIVGGGRSFASEAIVEQGSPLAVQLFFAFLAIIIIFQLLPGMTLFVNMLRGLFRRVPRKPAVNEGQKPRISL